MPDCEIRIETQDSGSSATAALEKAWVYRLVGSNIKVFRTNSSGDVVGLKTTGGDSTKPEDYTERYSETIDTELDLYFSRGAKPIPTSVLTSCTNLFTRKRLDSSNTLTTPGSSSATGTPGGTTTVTVSLPLIRIVLPNYYLAINKPAELSIWPLLWEPHGDNYLTLGLNQGGALWSGGNLTVTEFGSANGSSPSDRPAVGTSQVRPFERGLKVEGRIDARAAGGYIQIFDTAGSQITTLRQSSTSTTDLNQIPITVAAVSGTSKLFEATVFFREAVNSFGALQIVVVSDGMTPPIVEAFSCHLAGIQIVLVNDYLANPNGQSQGTIYSEADEEIVLDFLVSPQNNLSAISAQTRARRMLTHQMANRSRNLSATNTTTVLKPEMPLWMAEFQIVGMNKDQFEDLMVRRKNFLPGSPTILQFALSWSLNLSWDGPDSNTSSPRLYQYSQSFNANQTVNINLNYSNQIDGFDASTGRISNAFNTSPTPLNFPVTGRRLPQVIVSGQARRWGHQTTGQSKNTILIECQPIITDSSGDEIIRGGDGLLKLESFAINSTRIDRGVVPSGSGTVVPLSSSPDAELPKFRVRGLNPPSSANAVINALVEDYYNSHNSLSRISLLSLACWQETVRRILAHEAGRQFERRGTSRRRFGGRRYGHEQDMPLFGAPHGYGYGQHDNPPVSDDGAWSFFENIKESVRRIMEDKAGSAYRHISSHIPSPINQRIRAVYQRETVRRYNGGREFNWISSDWKISPSLRQWRDSSDHSKGPNPRLPYPNNTLGTSIVYYTGSGASTTFSWPIAFTASHYGPGT